MRACCRPTDPQQYSQPDGEDAFAPDFGAPPSKPPHREGDAMPGGFDRRNAACGSDPAVPQIHAGVQSLLLPAIAGYENLEVYPHRLSESRARGDLYADDFDG